MSWSKDQRPTHGHAHAASAAPQSSAHPAKSVMDRRWQQRRAAASARWAEVTSSTVLERADASGVQATAPSVNSSTTPAPLAERLLEDMRQLELKDAAASSRIASHALTPHASANANRPSWLGDTQRAMTIVAAISCGILLALLYFGGFLG